MMVPSAISWWGGVWQRSIACQLYLWLLNSYKHGTRIVIERDSRPKTYHELNSIGHRVQLLRSSTSTVQKLYKWCVLHFRIKNFTPFFDELSHYRITVE